MNEWKTAGGPVLLDRFPYSPCKFLLSIPHDLYNIQSDILLFHRKRALGILPKRPKMRHWPICQPEVSPKNKEMNIEDLICEQLINPKKKVELLTQKTHGGATERQNSKPELITEALSHCM
jgi:hypothetical protein